MKVLNPNTVKRESLVAIIHDGFSNMTIWKKINLAIFYFGIFKDGYVTINFSEFFKFANFAKEIITNN